MLNHNKSLFSSLICVSSLNIFSLQPVIAAESPLVAQMHVYEIVDAKKQIKTELRPETQVKPNSTLEYKVNYSNRSMNSLKGLKLNLPIPEHVSYMGTALPQNVYASTDGVNFAKAPLTHMVDGKKTLVPLQQYRVLQWHVTELKPKQTISVAAHVRVNAAE